MPVSSSRTVHKAENEHAETVLPARVTGRRKGTIITVRVWHMCDITVLPGRALGRVVGIPPMAVPLWQTAAKAGGVGGGMGL